MKAFFRLLAELPTPPDKRAAEEPPPPEGEFFTSEVGSRLVIGLDDRWELEGVVVEVVVEEEEVLVSTAACEASCCLVSMSKSRSI